MVQSNDLPFKAMELLEVLESVFGTTLGNNLARTCGSMFKVATPVSSSFMSARVEYCLDVAFVRS